MGLCGNGENGLSQKLSEHRVGEGKVIFRLNPWLYIRDVNYAEKISLIVI